MHSHAGAWEREIFATFQITIPASASTPALVGAIPLFLLVPTLLRGNPIRYAFPRGSMGTRNFRYFPNHNSNLCFNSRACRRDTSFFTEIGRASCRERV